MRKHCHFNHWRKANKIVFCLASMQNCLTLKLQSGSHEMKSMAVNILTLYKFNGKFIWKINIKYLLYQVPSGSCIKHLFRFSGKLQRASVECEPAANLFLENGQSLLFMQRKHLFYLKKQGRDSTLSLPLRQHRRCLLQKLFSNHWNSKLLLRKERNVILLLTDALLMLRI